METLSRQRPVAVNARADDTKTIARNGEGSSHLKWVTATRCLFARFAIASRFQSSMIRSATW